MVLLILGAPVRPCKQLGPVLEKVAAFYSNVRVARVNIDENEALGQQTGTVCSAVFVRLVVGRLKGFPAHSQNRALRQFVEKLIAQAPGAADILPLIEAGRAALSERQGDAALMQFQQALATAARFSDALS